MKTAISIPDDTFSRAEQAAAERGISRSELYTTAVEDYLRRTTADSLTARINTALDRDEGLSDIGEVAAAQGARTVLALTADDEW